MKTEYRDLNQKSIVKYQPENSESEEDEDDIMNLQQIVNNQILLNAQKAFESKEYDTSIKLFFQSLENLKKQKDKDREALIKANIAICYFHSCQYKKAEPVLLDALESLKEADKIRQADFTKSLYIKIYANLCILYIVLNQDEKQDEKSKFYNQQAINIILTTKDHNKKKELLEQLIYIYFRFQSFKSMGDGYFENLESKYDGATLACFFSSMGLNRELCGDLEQAHFYHNKALTVWGSLNEPGFTIITLKHLISLSERMQIASNTGQTNIYKQRLDKEMEHEDFKGIKQELLFKNFDKKIRCATQITSELRKIEEMQMHNSSELSKSQHLSRNLSNSQIEQVFDTDDKLWKLALKLRLRRSIQFTMALQKTNQFSIEQKKSITIGLEQMQQTLYLIDAENNEQQPLIDKQLKKLPYTVQAIVNVKSAIFQIKKLFTHIYFNDAFNILKTKIEQIKVVEFQHKQRYNQQKFINETRKVCFSGQYLLKCNKDTDSRNNKYYAIGKDGQIRWSNKDKHINTEKKCQYYDIKNIRGVVLGKASSVFQKSSNKKLEQWRCLSLILQKRSLDFYLEPQQVVDWTICLSAEVKLRNTQDKDYPILPYAKSPGYILWRIFKLKLNDKYQEQYDAYIIGFPQKHYTKFGFSFAQGIRAAYQANKQNFKDNKVIYKNN